MIAAVVILQTVFVAGVLFKLVASLAGIRSTRRRARRAAPERVADRDLPLYTVLVPVYHEANVVGGLIEHLRRLDYPPEKLEILLLDGGGRHRDDRSRARGRPARHRALHPHPRRPAEDEAAGVQRRPLLRPRRVRRDLRRRGPPRGRPAARRRGGVPRRRGRPRVRAGAAQLLQRPPERAHAHVHARVLVLVRLHAAWASTGCRCRSRSAGRPTTSAPIGCAAWAGGTRSTSPRTRTSACARRAEGYTVGIIASTTYEEACSQSAAVRAPAHPLDQGLHADGDRALAPAGAVHARGGPARTGRLPAPDRGHAGHVPGDADPVAADAVWLLGVARRAPRSHTSSRTRSTPSPSSASSSAT